MLGRDPRPTQLPVLPDFGNDLSVPGLLEWGWAWSWVSELSLAYTRAPQSQALPTRGGHMTRHTAPLLAHPPLPYVPISKNSSNKLKMLTLLS